MAVLPRQTTTIMVAVMMLDVVASLDEQRLAPISMRLKSEFPPDSWVRVNFYGDTFLRLYQCLSSNTSWVCSGHLARDEKQPFAESDRRVVGLDKPETVGPFDLHSVYFTCEHDFAKEEFSCRRLHTVDGVCDTHNLVQRFHMSVNNSSILNCVGLIWHSSGESLIFDKDIHEIKLCPSECNTTNAANISHGHDDQERPSWEDPQWRNDKSHWGIPRTPDDQFRDSKAHIIIIVVASIGVTTLLIVAAGIFRRKLLQMKVPPQAPTPDEHGDNRKPLNRKISSSSRNFSIHIPEKGSPVVLSPSKLFSDI